MNQQLLEQFGQIVGKDRVLTEEAIRAEKAVDLYALRLYQKHFGWQPTLPAVVLKPTTSQQVSSLLTYCQEQDLPVITYGGGSGVLAGAETRNPATVVIDLADMNRLIALDEVNQTVTCQAGMPLKELEALVNEKGFILGHYPQSFDLAQMGGLVATRSIGQFSTGYGGIEDMLLGLEVVSPDGRIMRIKSNPRRSVGPDLRQMWLGSEGAFGIITEVTVTLFRQPKERFMEAYRVESIRHGLKTIQAIMQTGIKPAVVRLHDWLECEKPYGAFMEEDECLLLFLSEGHPSVVAGERQIIEEVCAKEGLTSAGDQPVKIWLEHRNDAVDEYEAYGAMGFLVDTIEISAHWSTIADIYDQVVEKVYYEVPEIMFFSGHSSHSYLTGTNIYFQIGAMPGEDPQRAEQIYQQIWQIVMTTTLANQGSVGHHHGVGKHRVQWMAEEHGDSYSLIKQLKQGFDPKGIMNPGTLIN